MKPLKPSDPAPLRPESVDDGPSTADIIAALRAQSTKNTATIRTLRDAMKAMREQHRKERSKLRRDLRQSDLLLMVGAHELRTLREGYLRIAQEIETMMKGKHPNA
jgi:predicted glycosyltransferase